MALYRHDSTGFLCEYGSSPGAGYTAVTAFPGDTAGRISWWRARCVDAALGQSSAWHPSLSSSTELALPFGLAGRGVNIIPARYSQFKETGTGPEFYAATGASAAYVLSAGYISPAYVRVTGSSTNGVCWFSTDDTTYNGTLTPYRRWIISLFCAPNSSGARSFDLLVKTSASGAVYSSTFTTAASTSTWTRVYAAIDLSSDGSNRFEIGVRTPTSGSGGAVRVDGIMLEELIGDTITPSAFVPGTDTVVADYQVLSLPDDIVAGAQVLSGSIHSIVTQTTSGVTLPAYPSVYNFANINVPANNYRTVIIMFFTLTGVTITDTLSKNNFDLLMCKGGDTPGSGGRSTKVQFPETDDAAAFSGGLSGMLIDNSPGTGSLTYNLRVAASNTSSGAYTTDAFVTIMELSK